MNYPEAIAYLLGRVDYEQRGMPAVDTLRLDRIRRLLTLLDDPQLKYKVVHIAGTKGKGSTATMIAALLESTGIRTGLHTSPHFDRVEERMTVNGEMPTEAEFVALVEELQPLIAKVDAELPVDQSELTFFEITTAMTFKYFAKKKVEWAVIEVGMGGRLDATNVVKPELCVITSISLDHTKTLGNSVAEIAREKAGIIKPGIPVVSSAVDPDAARVVREVAESNRCELLELERDFRFVVSMMGISHMLMAVFLPRKYSRKFFLGPGGLHQAENASVACMAYRCLMERNGLAEPNYFDLENVRIPGRIEVIHHDPDIILDVAHNEASAKALAAALLGLKKEYEFKVLIFAATRDKDWRAMIAVLLPLFDAIVLTQYTSNLRAVPVERIAPVIWAEQKICLETATPSEAWQTAWNLLTKRETQDRTLVCVTGSFFLAAEIRPEIAKTLDSLQNV